MDVYALCKVEISFFTFADLYLRFWLCLPLYHFPVCLTRIV